MDNGPGTMEPIGEPPFYCGERSKAICVVLSSNKSSTYSSPVASARATGPRYASGVFQACGLAASLASFTSLRKGFSDRLLVRSEGYEHRMRDAGGGPYHSKRRSVKWRAWDSGSASRALGFLTFCKQTWRMLRRAGGGDNDKEILGQEFWQDRRLLCKPQTAYITCRAERLR